ncbi:MAG: rRNA pseudouridine synthase [Caulobacterales bacterium]|nr:rRNA pseudouridine synthase [Caulobacterales bacterium]
MNLNQYQFNEDAPMRINKYLAQIGVCSRRKAEELIKDRQVEVDGIIIEELGYKLQNKQIIKILEKANNNLQTQFSIIYHKPVGIVSGQAQENETPAIALIKDNNKSGEGPDFPSGKTIPPVGRLDKDSRGLLILSEDGILARNLIGPESKIEKEYFVKVHGTINDKKIAKLQFGLSLDGRQLKRAIVRQIDDDCLNFILKEGRNRQIRRMCAKVGLEVYDLYRVRIGNIEIGDLKEGFWRNLNQQEVNKIKS